MKKTIFNQFKSRMEGTVQQVWNTRNNTQRIRACRVKCHDNLLMFQIFQCNEILAFLITKYQH